MQQYISPKALSRVKDLPLVAKTLAHGFVQGLHTSRQRGVGVEFSQYRAYEPGDELGKVDWKLFARSDKYFVREAERESDINVWFVLDCSRSMLQSSETTNQKGSGYFSEKKKAKNVKNKNQYQYEDKDTDDESALSKLEYCKYLISTMSYLAQQQGDAVGFLALSSENTHFLPPFMGERHWKRMIIELSKVSPGGVFPTKEKVQAQVNNIQKNGLIILLSDFHQQNGEVTELACHLVNKRTQVNAFHLSTEEEISFPYQGAIRFQDLETSEEVLVSASNVRQSYLQNRSEKLEELNRVLSKHQIEQVGINIDAPLDETLYKFLKARNQVIK